MVFSFSDESILPDFSFSVVFSFSDKSILPDFSFSVVFSFSDKSILPDLNDFSFFVDFSFSDESILPDSDDFSFSVDFHFSDESSRLDRSPSLIFGLGDFFFDFLDLCFPFSCFLCLCFAIFPAPVAIFKSYFEPSPAVPVSDFSDLEAKLT